MLQVATFANSKKPFINGNKLVVFSLTIHIISQTRTMYDIRYVNVEFGVRNEEYRIAPYTNGQSHLKKKEEIFRTTIL